MKKVTHVITSLGLGGTEKYLSTLVDFQKDTYKVEIIILKEKGIIAEILQNKGYSIRVIKNIFSLYSYLKKSKPDILHTHLFRANIVGRIIGRLAGISVVISSQQSVDSWKKPWHWWVERLSSHWVDCIIANSQAAGAVLQKKVNISEKKIKMVYIGIDPKNIVPDRSREDICKEINIPPDKDIVVSIARFHKEKGSHFLPEIINKTIEKYKNAFFVLVGSGPLQKYVEREIKARNLEKYVIMLNTRLDIKNILNACSVFFLPSCEESFSNAALEAMSLKKPVVITDVGGNNELVDDTVNGFLVKPSDPHALAEKIVYFCVHKEIAAAAGENAQKKAYSFSMNDTLNSVDRIYQDIMK